MNSKINKFNGATFVAKFSSATMVAKFSGAALVVAMGLLASVGCTKHDDAPAAKPASEGLNSEIVSEIHQLRSMSPEGRATVSKLSRNMIAKMPSADLFLKLKLSEDEKAEKTERLDQDGRGLVDAIHEKCNIEAHTLDPRDFEISDSELSQNQAIEKSSLGLVYESKKGQCPIAMRQTLKMTVHPGEGTQADSSAKVFNRNFAIEDYTKINVIDSALREKLGFVAAEIQLMTDSSIVGQVGAEQNGNTQTEAFRIRSGAVGNFKFDLNSGEVISFVLRFEASAPKGQLNAAMLYKITFNGETLTIGAEKFAGKSKYYINGQEVSAGEILYEFGISVD